MRRSLFIAAFVAGVVGGCYLRPVPAPGFRYTCNTDADCHALDCKGNAISLDEAAALIPGCEAEEVIADATKGLAFRQSCIRGFCEYPCELSTFATDCPETEGFRFCFNNVCANLCGTGDPSFYGLDSVDDFCSSPQSCVPVGPGGLDTEQFGPLSAAFAMPFRQLPEGAGFCGQRCDAQGADPCPPGEYCTGALCIPDCTNDDATPCAAGSTCLEYGGFSACLVSCDPADPPGSGACDETEVCVPGANICQPSCVGEDAVDCAEGFTCNVELGICLPPSEDPTTGEATGTSGA